MSKLSALHNQPGQVQKFHHFELERKKSIKKGDLIKTKNGMYMIADKNNYVYHCPRCDTTIELDILTPVDGLNIQVAQRYSCA